MKMKFDNFQIQKWISQTIRAQKVNKKNGVICLVSFFPSWVMVLCADLSKKSKFVRVIYLNLSERPDHVLSENSMFYGGLSNSSQNIQEQNIRCWLSRNLTKFTNFKLSYLLDFKSQHSSQ